MERSEETGFWLRVPEWVGGKVSNRLASPHRRQRSLSEIVIGDGRPGIVLSGRGPSLSVCISTVRQMASLIWTRSLLGRGPILHLSFRRK